MMPSTDQEIGGGMNRNKTTRLITRPVSQIPGHATTTATTESPCVTRSRGPSFTLNDFIARQIIS